MFGVTLDVKISLTIIGLWCIVHFSDLLSPSGSETEESAMTLYGIRTSDGYATRFGMDAPITFTDNPNVAYSFRSESDAMDYANAYLMSFECEVVVLP